MGSIPPFPHSTSTGQSSVNGSEGEVGYYLTPLQRLQTLTGSSREKQYPQKGVLHHSSTGVSAVVSPRRSLQLWQWQTVFPPPGKTGSSCAFISMSREAERTSKRSSRR